MTEINTMNIFAVSATPMMGRKAAKPEDEGKQLTVCIPQFGTLTTEQALNLAAYIVCIADPMEEQFHKVLEAIKNA